MDTKLNEKQKRFCNEYLIDLNATQAAIRAGYSEKTSYSIGSELLKKPEVQTYLQHLADKRSEKLELTPEWVLEQIMDVAKTTAKDKDKLKALELLGKHLVLFTEKMQHGGTIKFKQDVGKAENLLKHYSEHYAGGKKHQKTD